MGVAAELLPDEFPTGSRVEDLGDAAMPAGGNGHTPTPLEWVQHEYRLELARRDATILRYRALLEEHGITPPDDEGKDSLEMWRGCRGVIETAFAFVSEVEAFREMLGTSKEFLGKENWR